MAKFAKRSYLHRPLLSELKFTNVAERLEELAIRYNDKEIYVFLDKQGGRNSISAKELFLKSRHFAYQLMKLGIKKGEVVGMCLPNSVEALVCMFGTIMAGAITLALLFLKEDGSYATDVLNRTNCVCVIIHPGPEEINLRTCMKIVDYANPDGSAGSKKVPSLRLFISAGKSEKLNLSSLMLDKLLKDDSPIAESTFPDLDLDNMAALMTTSGTTGSPKCVPFSHRNISITGLHLQESMACSAEDRVYSERRLAWVGGFPFLYVTCGLTTIMPDFKYGDLKRHANFNKRVIQEEQCTIAAILPTTMKAICSSVSGDESFKQLNNIRTGSLPISTACMDSIGIITQKVSVCYGSSEAGFISTMSVESSSAFRDYMVGKPHQGVEIKVVDENGAVVDRGVRGEIFVRSPAMFPGYYGDEEKTRDVLSRSGWFKTDDLGIITSDGKLVAMGRKSDIITHGGLPVIPSEIEAIIMSHPEVADAIVVPIPDPLKFQIPCACFVTLGTSQVTEEDIKIYCESQYLSGATNLLASILPGKYKRFIDFPRTFTGKPDKKQIIQDVSKSLHF